MNYQKKKNRLVVCFAVSLLVLMGCGRPDDLFMELEPEKESVSETLEQTEESDEEQAFSEEKQADEEEQTMFIHVCGAVENPGVYEIPVGSRVFKAVEAAGGFCAEAAEDYLNMAETLEDGSRLEIPTKKEAEALKKAEAVSEQRISQNRAVSVKKQTADKAGVLVNINTADSASLCTLPGIGKSRAEAILEYRKKQGSFQKPEDIMQVSGIGKKMYEKIKDKITV